MLRWPLTPLLPAALLLALATAAFGCDRFAYWSSTAEKEGADPVAGVAGVTATVSVGSGQVIIPADTAAVLASVGTCGAEIYARFAGDAGRPGDEHGDGRAEREPTPTATPRAPRGSRR
jgi:hypothetical protein